MSNHQQDLVKRDIEIPVGFQSVRGFSLYQRRCKDRVQETIWVISRAMVQGCRNSRGNRIFHLAGYWTNEKPFGENDSEMFIGNLTAMPSVQ